MDSGLGSIGERASTLPAPPSFLCYWTNELMEHPVRTVDDCAFEQEKIVAWFHNGNWTNPVTRAPLASQMLTPDLPLRAAIQEYLLLRPELRRQAADLQQVAATVQSELLEMLQLRAEAGFRRREHGFREWCRNLAREAAEAEDLPEAALRSAVVKLRDNLAALGERPGAEGIAQDQSIASPSEGLSERADGVGAQAVRPSPENMRAENRRGDVTALAVLSGWRLASGSSDTTIKIWAIMKRKPGATRCNPGVTQCVATLAGHNGGVTALATLRIGVARTRLASGSSDRTVKIWDVQMLQCIATLAGHPSMVTGLAALGWSSALRLASVSMDKCCESGGASGSRTPQQNVTWNSPSCVMIWHPSEASWSLERRLDGHARGHGVCAVAALETGELATGSDDAAIKIWNVGVAGCLTWVIFGNRMSSSNFREFSRIIMRRLRYAETQQGRLIDLRTGVQNSERGWNRSIRR